MNAVHFVLSNIFASVAAVLIADAAMKNREPWRRALAAIAGFPIIVLATVLSLGATGLLSAGTATLMVGALAGAAAAARWRFARRGRAASGNSMPPGAAANDPPDLHGSGDIAWPLTLTLLGGFGGGWAILLAVRATAFGTDDLSYHAPVAAHWIVDGRISLMPFNYHAYYPFNAEVISLWFMLPYHADGLASLSGLYWAALALTASSALVVAQGHPKTIAALVGALLLASPVLLQAARTFSAVDLAPVALVLGAIAMTAPSKAGQTDRATLVDAAYAGALAGFVTGCRVSFAPVTLVLFLWQAFGRRRHARPGTWLCSTAAFAAAALGTGACWYVRTWLVTGNPVFPAALGPFDGPFGAAEQSRTRLVHWIMASWTDASFWRTLIAAHIDWPFGLFVLATVGYGAGLWSVVRYRRTMDVTTSAIRSLLLVVGLGLLVLYPFMPFSGGANEPDAALTISLRYVVVSFAIGIVLFASHVPSADPGRALGICLAVLALVTTEVGDRRLVFVIVASGIVTLALWALWPRVAGRTPVPRILRLGTVPALLVLLAIVAPYKQRLTDLGFHGVGDAHRPIGDGWRALEDLPAGARIAWYGPATWTYYPVFGRRLHLNPTAVFDGWPYRPVHELFGQHSYPWWNRSEAAPEPGRLLPALIAARVSYVFVTKWDGDEWPPEQDTLEKSGRARAIYNDGYSAIWAIDPDSGRDRPPRPQ
jgi:hypothetical protein